MADNYNLILNNIQFTVNTDETIDGFITKRTKSDLVTRNHKYDIVTKQLSIDENINTSFINAVDIDWNNAYLPQLDTYINSTGELLSQIELIYSQLQNKADKSEIPTRISQLRGYDDLATISWVQNQFLTYAKTPYDVYVEYQQSQGYPYMEKPEWLESLKGTNGLDGKSAFQIAQDYGFTRTEREWLESLKGDKGDQGEKGDPGASINIIGYYDTLEELKEATIDTINSLGDAYNVGGKFYVYNDEYTSIDDKWKPAGTLQGPEGKSAYEVAIEAGFTGTTTEWLNTLQGATGISGKSAFEIYKDFGGQIDNETDWLVSLNGEQGIQGATGVSGKSAFEIAQEFGYTGTQEDWINKITNGNIYTAGTGICISADNVISIIDKETNEYWVTVE